MHLTTYLHNLLSRPKLIKPHYGWAVIGIVFAGMAVGIGGTHYSFGVFVEPLEKQFQWSRTEVNAAMSFSAVSSLSGPLIGRALDKFGAKPVMTISMLLIALSFSLRPFMDNLWHWYSLSFIHFVGFPGASMLVGPKLVSAWFPRTRGRMMGVASMGANFGGIIFPTSIGSLIVATSWKWGFALLGVIAGLVGIAASVIVKDRPDNKLATRLLDKPSQRERISSRILDPDHGATVREALTSLSFYGMTLAVVSASFAYSAVLSQIIPHLQNEGLSLHKATMFLSLMAVFGMIGKVSFGYLTERIPSKNVLAFSLVLQSLSLVSLILTPDSTVLWAVMPVFGIGFGGMGSSIAILAQDTVGLKNFGSLFGLVTLATVASSLLGPLIVGSIFDARGNYDQAFLVIIIIFGVGIGALQAARPMPQATGRDY